MICWAHLHGQKFTQPDLRYTKFSITVSSQRNLLLERHILLIHMPVGMLVLCRNTFMPLCGYKFCFDNRKVPVTALPGGIS